MPQLRMVVLAACMVLATAMSGEAQVIDYWGLGSDPAAWNDPFNWVLRGGGFQVPQPEDLVVLGDTNNNGGAININLLISSDVAVDSLRTGALGAAGTNQTTVTQSAGILTIGGDTQNPDIPDGDIGLWLGEFGETNPSTYSLTGGSIVVTDPGESFQVGRGTPATFTMESGTSVTIAGVASVGKFGPFGNGSFIMNGGTFRTNAIGEDAFFVGQNGAPGAVTMTDGTVLVGADGVDAADNPVTLGVLHVGLDSTAVWNQSAGLVRAGRVEVGRFQSPTADVTLSGTATWDVANAIALSGSSATFPSAISSSLMLEGSGLSVTAGGFLGGAKSTLAYVADASGISTLVLRDPSGLYQLDSGAELSLDFGSWIDDGSSITLVDAAGAWTGNFLGLPEGTLIPALNRTITYAGGDGFDIMLLAASSDIVFNVPSGTQTQAEAGYPTISTADSVTKTGAGTIVFNAANAYTGPTTVSAGTLEVANSDALGATNVTVDTGATLAIAAGTTMKSPAVIVDGGTLSASTVTVASGTGITSLAINAGTLAGSPAVTVGSGGQMALAQDVRVTVAVGSLSLAETSGGGRIDLGAGEVNVAAGGISAADLRADIIAGRNGGGWNGATGITSSTAAASGGTRAVGYVVAGDGSAKVSFAASGDVDLSGAVNVFDLVSINSSGKYGTGAASVWNQGDFTYDGVTNVFDLVSVNTGGVYGQGNYFPAPAAVSSLTAVPEPGLWPVVVGSLAAGLAFRRGRSKD
ncbi:MAG: hypothetical protein RLZZ440_431 [Planctomycetota bacterium]